ncbi:MAG: single-stranded-DNA-specific exonuclease RecJ [Chloroflexi bacterium]|nr:single-stranded-DNA-specific exonuclease RecJ [Chloroflexota bacterium]
MNHKRWKVLSCLKDTGPRGDAFSPLVSQLLRNRGINRPELFEPFISADRRLAGDALQLPDIRLALDRVFRALTRGEKISIYGDFDTDGLTGTALLVQGLHGLGATVSPYIPDRFEEGHGLKIAALETLKGQGVSLVITVDCGISDNEAASYARSVGLDLIVTDHHTLTSPLPEALAVIDPKRPDSVYPFDGLCGAGLAFKLLEAIYRAGGHPAAADGYLDLVALGTITDMVPLVADNRFLVKQGLEALNKPARPGLIELMKTSGTWSRRVEAEDVAWTLGPRLNAAGRVDHARLSYDLLTTSSAEQGRALAQQLEDRNAERQRLTEGVLTHAREQARAMMPESKILIVSGPGYHAGVHGLVANRLVDEFYRPSIVMDTRDGMCNGSARSIAEFDIIAALMRCHGLLTRYGGHPGAAGFRLPVDRVAEFSSALQRIAGEQLDGLDLRPEIAIDAEIPLSSYLGMSYRSIRSLAPFGKGNPQPTFLSRGVKVLDCRPLGNGGRHLKCKFKAGNTVWTAVGFDLGEFAAEITPQLDIVYRLDVDTWCNQETIELHLLDFQPSRQMSLRA